MSDAANEQMIRRLRLERHAKSDEVLTFWREHGRKWAREEAGLQDITRIATVSEAARGQFGANATSLVAAELKNIWKDGFQNPADAFGWNEMNDHLPEAALFAFVQGVESAWLEVSNKI
jgi:hypothetical protein